MNWRSAFATFRSDIKSILTLGPAEADGHAAASAIDRGIAAPIFPVAYLLLFPEIVRAFGLSSVSWQTMFEQLWASPAYLAVVAILLYSTTNTEMGNRAMGFGPLRFVGNISYSVYLLHVPVLVALGTVPQLAGHPTSLSVVFVPIVLFVAWLSNRFVEQPLQRLINRAGYKEVLPRLRN